MWFSDTKVESQLVHSPTSINHWGSALPPLFDFGQVLQLRLRWNRSQLLTIDQSHVAIGSLGKSDGNFRFSRHSFSFATIGIVHCTSRRLLLSFTSSHLHFLCLKLLFYLCLVRMEWKPCIVLAATVNATCHPAILLVASCLILLRIVPSTSASRVYI